MAVGETVENNHKTAASCKQRLYLDKKKWRMKLDESKSVHNDFTNKKV
jgi:hypothetical protein